MEVLGKGSLVQRDTSKTRSRCRKWELSVTVEDGGKKSKRTRPFSGPYTRGKDALKEFREEIVAECEASVSPSGYTAPQWAREWHRIRERSMTLAPKTLAGDQQKINIVDMHLDMPLDEVTSDTILDVYWKIMEGETPSGKVWEPKSLENLHKAFVGMFGMAKKKGKIAKNPMDDVSCPKVPKKRQWFAPSKNIDYLLEYLDYSSQTQRGIALMAGCGLRLSEAERQDWSDVGDSVMIRDPKTDAGDRSIPMPRILKERLLPYRSRGLVCGGVRGDSMRRWLKRNDARFFVPNATPHGLRRSYCTRLAEAGVHPRVMMELMGHSSIDVCMEVYTYVYGAEKKDAVESAFSM